MTDKVYFKVKKDSQLYKDWFEYKENGKNVSKLFNEFAKEHGIEANSFVPLRDSLNIVPTENDEIKFANQLKKHKTEQGVREFKLKSPINKAWRKFMVDVVIRRRPSYWNYIQGIGTHSGSLFNLNEVVYGSLETTYTYEKPDWMEEIKASEYFKDVEDYNESIKTKQ